jgi:hypothetical protein
VRDAARHPNQSVPTNPEQQDASGVDEQDRHDAPGVDVAHRIHDFNQSALAPQQDDRQCGSYAEDDRGRYRQ